MNTKYFRAVFACAVCAAALSGCGGYSSNGKDYSTPTPSNQVASLSVTPTSASIAVGETQQFKVTAKNSAGSSVAAGTVAWHSSDESVATVNSKGLATAVAAGTADITATRTITTTDYYGNQTNKTITSNKATLTVMAADQVMGMIAAPQGSARMMVLVRGRNGTVQAALADDTGRFTASVAGMEPPYLIQARSQHGEQLYSVATAAGVVNVNPATDFLVRALFRAKGTSADTAFASREALTGPDRKTVAAMDASLKQAFSSHLQREGLSVKEFSFFNKSYVSDGSGYDRLFRELRTRVTPTTLSIRDLASGRTAAAAFGTGHSAQLQISGAGRERSIKLVAAD